MVVCKNALKFCFCSLKRIMFYSNEIEKKAQLVFKGEILRIKFETP